MNISNSAALRELADLNGVQISFVDASGQVQAASSEALSALLGAFGVPAGNEREIRENLRQSRLRPYRRGLEPVWVVWQRRGLTIRIHLPAKLAARAVRVRIRMQNGNQANIA